jgi:hypothetical protein
MTDGNIKMDLRKNRKSDGGAPVKTVINLGSGYLKLLSS